MKTLKYLSIFILILISFNCSEDKLFNSPYDSDNDPDRWKPKDLEIQQINITNIKLDWDQDVKDIDGFKIDRKIGSRDWENEIITINKDKKENIDTTAIPDSLIYYRVYAYAEKNNSSYISKSINNILPKPTNLSFQLINDQSIEISWNDSCSFENGYKIERKLEGENYILIDSVVANITGYTDDSLTYGETYYYRIKAFTDLNESDYTNEISVQTVFPAPTDLSYQLLSDQSAKISWSDNCSFESGYKIERKLEGENYTLIDSVNANITNYTNEGLTLGETYYYRVKAFTNLNESDYSSELSVRTEFPAPTNLSYQLLSDQSVKISWNDNCSFESGYKIERKLEGENYTLIDSVVANITEYTDNGLTYGETYYYRVKAFTNLNESDYTNEVSFKVLTTFKKTFGGSGSEIGYSVEETSDGGFIITGYTNSYEAGNDDIWLIKTDANGNKEWDKIFDESGCDEGNSVQETSDGGFIITGRTNSYEAGSYDVWLIKTDNNGNKLWDKTFGGSDYEVGYSVEETSDGGFIITGCTMSYGAGSYDVWLIKTDANGNKEWDKTFGGSDYDWGYSVEETNDDGFIITGYTDSYGAGSHDIWLIKTDANGNKLWDKTFGGYSDDKGYSVEETSDGGFIIMGHTQSYGVGSEDVWLIKTDENGNKEWDKTFGGYSQDRGYSVQETSDGGFIITGFTYSYGAGGYDVWLIKTDKNGNSSWYKTFGGSGYDKGYSVQETSDGGFIITGYTMSYGAGNFDVWLIKTDQNGDVFE